MMLRDLSLAHILILLVIVLLVFGARRLPEIGSSLGKGIKEFKKSLSEVGGGNSSTSERTTLPPSDQRAETHESGEPKRLSD
jgi:sec-independent protein translocase protein TatA